MRQATPPASATTRPQAGHHSPRTTPARDAASGNGRRPFAAEPVITPAVAPAPAAPFAVTLEFLFYALIFVAACLTRFWDLGSRALHHDESLHAYFSWQLATGQGYAHDPLMHGPFLFHLNALVYALLGASDASSRFAPAFFGVILITLPLLLRGERHLGRWGALTASALLLISPALLYQSRYIRHDVFTVTGALFLLIAIVRYVEQPSRGWLIAIGATLGFLLTNHEIVFGIAAIFFAVIAGALLWGHMRPLVPVVLLAGIAAIALVAFLPDATRPLPTIPWSSPAFPEQMTFYRDLLGHPLTIALVLLAIATMALSLWLLRRQTDPATREAGWDAVLFGNAPPGTIAAAVRAAWNDGNGVSWSLLAGLLIFTVLFTTLFTNLEGLATGTISTDGTLLYWLGQHDYRRGEQPWFYYLLLMPQYELIAAFIGGAATIIAGVRALLVGLGRITPGPRFVFQTFLAVWFVGILLALSWAGEKMPWLVTHITLPATLLAAALMGEAWERWRPASDVEFRVSSSHVAGDAGDAGIAPTGDSRLHSPSSSRLPSGAVIGSFVALAACWFLVAAPLTYGEFVSSTLAGGWERTLAPWAREHWWLLALPPLAGIVLFGAAWMRGGVRAAVQPALAALVLVLALAQIHVAWRLVYQEGDIPRDMLVYTQTSPDMHRMTEELTTLSARTTGGKDMENLVRRQQRRLLANAVVPARLPETAPLRRHAGRPARRRADRPRRRRQPRFRRSLPGGLHGPGVRAALVVPGGSHLPRFRHCPRDQPRPLGLAVGRAAAWSARYRRLRRRERVAPRHPGGAAGTLPAGDVPRPAGPH